MATLADTIIIKSDQLNTEDLVTGDIIARITKVTKKAGDQPISIYFEGDGGKPWKPCLSMRKLLLAVWGDNIDDCYIGRSLQLTRDPKVKWAGREEGGIRIAKMSHITEKQTHFLTETRGVKKPHVVLPLTAASSDFSELKKQLREAAEKGMDNLKKCWGELGGVKQKSVGGAEYLAELKTIAEKTEAANLAADDSTTQSSSATSSVPPV